jgi:hypothetical protein
MGDGIWRMEACRCVHIANMITPHKGVPRLCIAKSAYASRPQGIERDSVDGRLEINKARLAKDAAAFCFESGRPDTTSVFFTCLSCASERGLVLCYSLFLRELPKQAMPLRVPRPVITPAPRNPRRVRAAKCRPGPRRTASRWYTCRRAECTREDLQGSGCRRVAV